MAGAQLEGDWENGSVTGQAGDLLGGGKLDDAGVETYGKVLVRGNENGDLV